MELSAQHIAKVKASFCEDEVPLVIAELQGISTSHTWDSKVNLENTVGAILNLSAGNAQELNTLVEAAKIDFRDVIYWWALEQGKATPYD